MLANQVHADNSAAEELTVQPTVHSAAFSAQVLRWILLPCYVALLSALTSSRVSAQSVAAVGQFESGGASALYSVKILPDGTAWGVGEGIAHWNGKNWRQDPASRLLNPAETCSTGVVLYGLDIAGDGFGLAVGSSGLLLEFRRGNWSSAASFTANDLTDVLVLSELEAWAVGTGIWHYIGGAWSQVPIEATGSPTPRLEAIAAGLDGEAWAVGAGIIARFRRGIWAAVNDVNALHRAGEGYFYDVAVGGTGTVVVVGEQSRIVIHQQGQWTLEEAPVDATLRSVTFDEFGTPWIGFDMSSARPKVFSPLLRRVDNTWALVDVACLTPGVRCPYVSSGGGDSPLAQNSSVTESMLMYYLMQIDSIAFGSSGGWAVGGALLVRVSPDGAVMEGDFAYQPTDIDIINSNDGWAVGDNGLILHRLGGDWIRVPTPTGRLHLAIDMLSADSGWIVGERDVLRLADGIWRVSERIPYDLLGVAMETETTGWAVGKPINTKRGMVIERTKGAWTERYRDEEDGTLLLAVEVSEDEGWAVGQSGRIVHYADGLWRRTASPTDETLFVVSIGSDETTWVAGESVLLEWRSNQWHTVSLPDIIDWQGRYIAGVVVRSQRDRWMLVRDHMPRDNPILLHFDGVSWSVLRVLPCLSATNRLYYGRDDAANVYVSDSRRGIYRQPIPLPDDAVMSRLYLPRLNW